MTTLMITHPVVDFDSWRVAFDAGAAIRARHGATAVRLLRDGSGVVGLIDFPDDGAATAFLADPALRAPIDGVPDRPEIRLLSDLVGRAG